MRLLHRFSQWFHRIFGLGLTLFLVWMVLTGILLNHPRWIAPLTVPSFLIPGPYHGHQWNLGMMRHGVAGSAEGEWFFGGLRGIWRTQDGGQSWHSAHRGLDKALFYRKTNHLWRDSLSGRLLAATDGGAFVWLEEHQSWRRVFSGAHPKERCVRWLRNEEGLVLVTSDGFYRLGEDFLVGEPLTPTRPVPDRSLIELTFALHDGSLLGLTGRLLVDAVGLCLIFLTLGAFLTWSHRKVRQKWGRFLFRIKTYSWLFRWHRKMGWWLLPFLFVLAVTGALLRPPLLVLLANGSVPASWRLWRQDNPWKGTIKNACLLADGATLLVEADGFWQGRLAQGAAFQPVEDPGPVFVMGTTVLEVVEDSLWIGSFSGVMVKEGQEFKDLLTNERFTERSRFRPQPHLVTGLWRQEDGGLVVATQHQGLLRVPGGEPVLVAMPEALSDQPVMPLWDYCFEWHNGRIFSFVLGSFSKWLVPLAALLFVGMVLTGLVDEWVLRRPKGR